jgi:hypothetical protein
MDRDAFLDSFGEIIADASDAIDEAILVFSKQQLQRGKSADEDAFLRGEAEGKCKAIKERVKTLAKEYLSLRTASMSTSSSRGGEGPEGRQLRDALLRTQNEKLLARVEETERENAELKRELKVTKEDCALLVRAARMAREEFTRLDKLDEEGEEEEDNDDDDDDDVVTVKSLASSGGATYGSGVQTSTIQEDEVDDDRGPGRNKQSLHDMLDLDDQYKAALEKLRATNISPTANKNNNKEPGSPQSDKVTQTAKAAAMFAATAALYSHSGINATSNSGGKTTNKSSGSEGSSEMISNSGGQMSAAALCVDDESDQGQVFRTPVMIVSDHPDALSSSDEENVGDEGTLDAAAMQNALDRVLLKDSDDRDIDSPSLGTTTTTTKNKKSGNKTSFLNALPP